MDAQRWRLVRELFEAVVDAPTGQWEDLLQQCCPADDTLRAEVLALLHADAAATRATAMLEQAPDIVAGLAQELTGQHPVEPDHSEQRVADGSSLCRARSLPRTSFSGHGYMLPVHCGEGAGKLRSGGPVHTPHRNSCGTYLFN
jgi:serine/threonine-protein kinase